MQVGVYDTVDHTTFHVSTVVGDGGACDASPPFAFFFSYEFDTFTEFGTSPDLVQPGLAIPDPATGQIDLRFTVNSGDVRYDFAESSFTYDGPIGSQSSSRGGGLSPGESGQDQRVDRNCD
jgi:hypothetical protein